MGNIADPSADPVVGEMPVDFDDFYTEEWPSALRLATLLTQRQGVAEDLAQEAFARVLAAWDRIERPGAYLNTTLVNACRTWHRRQTGERDRLPLLLPADAEPAEFDDLSDALATLPYRQRAVIVLRYYADLPEREIADALGCAPGTVKSLASRALTELRRVIER